MNTWPRVTGSPGDPGILHHHHLYDQFPDEGKGYYFRRGNWIGGACDVIAMGGALDETHESYLLGVTPQIMPISGNAEVWLDYVEHFQDLITSPGWRGIFDRCLDVQQEVRNETERYAGHYDQRWTLRQYANEALIDIKTGSCGPVTGLQLALYDMALGGPRRRRYGVLLRADAPAKLIPFTDSRDYDRARILARAWWVSREYLA